MSWNRYPSHSVVKRTLSDSPLVNVPQKKKKLVKRKSNSLTFHLQVEGLLSSLPSRTKLVDSIQCPIIVFDIETNKLGTDAEIVQLAAVDCTSPDNFYKSYCVPSMMDPESSKVNQLYLKTTDDGTSTLVNHEGNILPTTSLKECLSGFIDFISKRIFVQEGGSQLGPHIVAHNGFKFDFPILLNQLSKVKLSLPSSTSFADTFLGVCKLSNGPAKLRRHLPERFRLIDLVSHMQPEFQFLAHDALGDCLALQTILIAGLHGKKRVARKKFIYDSYKQFLEYGLVTNINDYMSIRNRL